MINRSYEITDKKSERHGGIKFLYRIYNISNCDIESHKSFRHNETVSLNSMNLNNTNKYINLNDYIKPGVKKEIFLKVSLLIECE